MAVGSLTERKNLVRLADAFATLGRGSLTFVGDGPLRAQLEGRERVRVVGPRPARRGAGADLAAADVVCAPSLLEPFGQSILEAMAAGKTVVATRIGGPPEFVPPEAGILVDPLDEAALARALEAAAAFPSPNEAARAAAAGARRQASGGAGGGGSASSRSRSASLTSTSGRDLLLDPCLARERERLLLALPRLRGSTPCLRRLSPVDEGLLDTNRRSPSIPPPYVTPTRVLIADDSHLFGDALELILDADDGSRSSVVRSTGRRQ